MMVVLDSRGGRRETHHFFVHATLRNSTPAFEARPHFTFAAGPVRVAPASLLIHSARQTRSAGGGA